MCAEAMKVTMKCSKKPQINNLFLTQIFFKKLMFMKGSKNFG